MKMGAQQEAVQGGQQHCGFQLSLQKPKDILKDELLEG